jgi:RNA polymerase-binding transcription factor DksA
VAIAMGSFTPEPARGPPGDAADRPRLDTERAAILARLDALSHDFEAIVATAAEANGDDEHDPEGATVAFERSQVDALLHGARAALARLDQACSRLAAGTYGVCTRCAGPIGAERLEARPAALTCMPCASAPSP